jgi:hypothetical protein
MALVKTNYGLIYNDDGSLCVTIRKDDVPFPGVTSFALEEGTTNYWNNDITDYAYRVLSGGITFENTVYNGRPALKCIVTGTNPYIRVAFKHSAGNINPGDTYTASIGVAALSSEITGLVDTAAFIYFTRADFAGFKRPDHNWGKVGNRIYATCTHPTDDFTTPFYACVYFKEAGTFYLYDYQLEKKPFATSFTEGTRPHGIVKLTNPPLPLDNFVINLWFKPTRYPAQTGQALHLFNVSYNASAFQGLELVAPPPSYTFVLRVRNSSSTFTDYNLGFDLSAEVGKWHMITLISNGNTVDVYIDAEKRVSAINNIPRSAIEFIVFGRYFRNIRDSGMQNGFLMSNVLFASYDPAIWTDEYIRTIYQTKRPFAVPPKLPIV